MALFIDHVNVVLNKLRQAQITSLVTDPNEKAYNVQIAVRRAVARIWNYKKWTFKQRRITFSTTNAISTYRLSKVIGEPYKFLGTNSGSTSFAIRPVPEDLFDFKLPNPTHSGQPNIVTLFDMVGVTDQPTAASTISITSSSASDSTQVVTIRGYVSGQIEIEEVTLNGVSAASTVKSFTSILAVSKSAATVGQITLTSNSGAITNLVMAPQEKTVRFRQCRLYPTPDATYTITVKFFAAPPQLTNRYEDTEIPERWDYIVEQFAFALSLQPEGQEQLNEFTTQMQLAVAMLENDMSTEESQSTEDIIQPLKALDGGSSLETLLPSGYGFIDEI